MMLENHNQKYIQNKGVNLEGIKGPHLSNSFDLVSR